MAETWQSLHLETTKILGKLAERYGLAEVHEELRAWVQFIDAVRNTNGSSS